MGNNSSQEVSTIPQYRNFNAEDTKPTKELSFKQIKQLEDYGIDVKSYQEKVLKSNNTKHRELSLKQTRQLSTY
jgi:hypothetical protein